MPVLQQLGDFAAAYQESPELRNLFASPAASTEAKRGVAEKIAARLNNGVLMLQLPRAEKAKPRQIPVQVETAKEAA